MNQAALVTGPGCPPGDADAALLIASGRRIVGLDRGALSAAEVALRVGRGVSGRVPKASAGTPLTNSFDTGAVDITAARREPGFAPRTGLAAQTARTAGWLRAGRVRGMA